MEIGCKTDYHIGKRRTTKESSEAFNLMALWLFCLLFVFHFPVYAPVAPVVEFLAHDAERLAAVAFCAPVPRNVGEVLP